MSILTHLKTKMNSTLNVVAVSGSTFLPSRTLALTNALLKTLGQHLQISSHLIHLGDIARPLGAALMRQELTSAVENELKRIESADLLVIASPVYRASIPGHLKHLIDLLEIESLVNKPVLLAATGGSDRHALVIEHQLRPLLSFMQSLTLPIGVYGSNTDFQNYQVSSSTLADRVELAVQRLLPMFTNYRHHHLQASGLTQERILA